jgi:serine/threonine protein kinase
VKKSSVVSQHASSDFVAKHYDVGRELGKGAFGRVDLVTDQITGQERVCKLVSTQDMAANTLEMMKKEVELLCQLDHPNVIRIFEYAFDESRAELVMILEYLRGGDCFDLLEIANGQPLNEALLAGLIHQGLIALCYCHSQGVVHRDVKPDNLMLLERIDLGATHADCKLIDFGIAAHRDIPKRGLYGTPPYAAPDVAVFAKKRNARQVKDITPKADVWSLGVTAFQLLLDEGPFSLREPRCHN